MFENIGYFDWSLLSEKELTEAKMTVGLGRHNDIRRHSQWKTSKPKWQGKEWRFRGWQHCLNVSTAKFLK